MCWAQLRPEEGARSLEEGAHPPKEQACPLERYIEVYGLCLGEATGAQSLSPIVAQPRQGWHSRAPCKILDCQDSDGGSLLLSKCE